MSDLRLTFLGAVGTVTGSRFLLEGGGTRLLVDCGLFQGVKYLRERNWRPFAVEPAALDAVVLTHAHLDHSGYLPALVRDGFRGPVHCTRATADLCGVLLPDSGYLQEEEASYASRRGYSKHKPPRPLYTQEDAEASLRSLRPVAFGDAISVGPFEIRFHRAGHILGAACVEVRGLGRTVLFSGDLGRPDDLLMHAPNPPPAADYVVIESTYGNRNHANGDLVGALAAVASRTFDRGGVLVIPAFAVGRAQLVLHALQLAIDRGLVPEVPMHLNSPMATDVTELYLRHAKDHRLDRDAVQRLCRRVEFVRRVEDSKRLNQAHGPRVIVSASGMLTGGRVLHHLKAFGPDPANTILLAGFQAPGTRGGALVAGSREVKIHGQPVPIEAEVVYLDMFSAHADRSELLGWLGRIPAPPRKVFIVHGEHLPADSLRLGIRDELGFDAQVPEEREAVPLP